jgi:hypothetical protein
MLLTTSLLALSLLGTPPQCAAPTQTGIYRITAVTKDSSIAKIGMVLMENVENCLEVSILTDDGGPAMMDNIQMDGDVLTGNVRLVSGPAKVTLRFAQNGISGTIGEGKKVWSLSGRRTTVNANVAAGDVIKP